MNALFFNTKKSRQEVVAGSKEVCGGDKSKNSL